MYFRSIEALSQMIQHFQTKNITSNENKKESSYQYLLYGLNTKHSKIYYWFLFIWRYISHLYDTAAKNKKMFNLMTYYLSSHHMVRSYRNYFFSFLHFIFIDPLPSIARWNHTISKGIRALKKQNKEKNSIFFFFDCCHGMWKFLCKASNPSYNSDRSCCSDNTGYLTHFVTSESPKTQLFLTSCLDS